MSGQKTLNAENEQLLYDAVCSGECFSPADIAARTGWSACKAAEAVRLLRRMAGDGRSNWTIAHLARGRRPVPYAVFQLNPGTPVSEEIQRSTLRGQMQSIAGSRRRMVNDAATFDIMGQALPERSVLKEACQGQAVILRGGAEMAKRVLTEVKRHLAETTAARPPAGRRSTASVA